MEHIENRFTWPYAELFILFATCNSMQTNIFSFTHYFIYPTYPPVSCFALRYLSTMSKGSSGRSSRKWKDILRRLRLQPVDQGPKPSQRQNTSRHLDDLEEGYFCDSMFTVLHARGALRSESDLRRTIPRESDLQVHAHLCNDSAEHQEWSTMMEDAEVGQMQVCDWDGPGAEPIGSVAYRLVKHYLAKRFKRSEGA